MSFFALMGREITILLKRRKLILFILLFGASAYALLVGNLYRNHVVTTIPLVICDQDQSSLSRSLARYIIEADRVQVIASVQDEKEAYALLDKKKAEGLIIIPQDFSKKISRHEPVSLLFLTDGTNSLYQGYAMAPVQQAAAQFSAEREMETASLEKVPYLPAAPVYPSFRIKENPTQSYSFFYLYGVTITAAQIGLMLSFAESLYEDLRNRTFQKISILKLLLAKEITFSLLSTAALLPALTLITGFFHMPYKGSFLLFFALYVVYTGAALFMAALITFAFKTEIAMVQFLVFYALPSFLLSGYIWPDDAMLPMMKWISLLIPLHYITTDFRSLALSGTSGTFLSHFLILLTISTAGYFFTAWMIRRRMRENL